jgi:N-acetylated-alpha-linked acidic dipeptidase
MNTFGDPGFHYHVATAKFFGLFTARLAEAPVIPLCATDYALALDGYISNAESKLSGTADEDEIEARARPTPTETKGNLDELKLSFKKLHKAARKLEKAAKAHDAWAAELTEEAGQDIPWWKWFSKLKLYYNIRRVNDKYKYLERQFLHPEGLGGRPWFKHIVFAPGLWTGYAGAVFPGLVEAIDARDYGVAEKWVGIIENSLRKAAQSLE